MPDLTSNLRFRLSCDDSTVVGTTISDQSEAGNDGTLVNGVGSTAGKFGQARSFVAASDQRIAFPEITNLENGDFSFSVWIKPNNVTSYMWLAQATDSGITGGPSIFITNAGGVVFEYGTSSGASTPGGVLTAGVWNHIFCILKFSTTSGTAQISINVNGVLEGINSNLTIPRLTGKPFIIGGPDGLGGVGAFDGAMDEMWAWNRGLVNSDVVEMYDWTPATQLIGPDNLWYGADNSDDDNPPQAPLAEVHLSTVGSGNLTLAGFTNAFGTAIPAEMAVIIDGDSGNATVHTFSDNVRETLTVSIPSGNHTVILRACSQTVPSGTTVVGTFLSSFTTDVSSFTVSKPSDPDWVGTGDSILFTGAYASPITTCGVIPVMRDSYGVKIACDGAGFRSLHDYYISGFTAFVDLLLSYNPQRGILISLCFNDKRLAEWASVSDYQTQYGVLLDMIHAAAPGLLIIAISAIVNADGTDAQPYRDAVQAESATRTGFVQFIDGTTLADAANLFTDQIHLTTVGMAQAAQRLFDLLPSGPTVNSVASSTDGMTLICELSESGMTPTGFTGADFFDLNGDTRSSVVSGSISGTTLTLTLDFPLYNGQVATIGSSGTSSIVDGDGNPLTVASTLTITNNSTVDAAVPSGFSGSPGNTVAHLSWSAPDPNVVFNVYRNGSFIGGPADAQIGTFTDTGRTNGTTYAYTVKAVAISSGTTTLSAAAGLINITPNVATPAKRGVVQLLVGSQII